MSYTSRIQIRETESELCCAYRKTKDLRTKLRIKALILFKEGNFQKQEDLALHLCIGYSTLRRWLKKYTDEGFEKYIR
ncbi:MAG: helix-turn-helix domain-containing protein, partial [Marinifilum sp.]|nr:helix-turn-helix domain-containing protein [Marinifilum sp.]